MILQARTELAERFAAGGLVKICGLREPEHAAAAAVAGADLLGFVFAPARRRVTPEQARRCIAAARDAVGPERRLFAVGVFVNASGGEIAEAARVAGLDLVQLHGDEPPGFSGGLPVPAVKALKPSPSAMVEEAIGAARAQMAATRPPLALLIDGHHPTSAGGSGVRADWAVATRLATGVPMILAGGLNPENVAEAIRTVRPLGVDVSSGVERDGVKDAGLIAAFVDAARGAYRDLGVSVGSPGG